MGDPKTTFWQEAWQLIGKAAIFIWYITIGVLIKIALDSRTEVLTRRKIWIKVTISVSVGYLATQVCIIFKYMALAGLIVPVCTLLGESITVYVMSNWKRIADKWLPGIFLDKKKDNGNYKN